MKEKISSRLVVKKNSSAVGYISIFDKGGFYEAEVRLDASLLGKDCFLIGKQATSIGKAERDMHFSCQKDDAFVVYHNRLIEAQTRNVTEYLALSLIDEALKPIVEADAVAFTDIDADVKIAEIAKKQGTDSANAQAKDEDEPSEAVINEPNDEDAPSKTVTNETPRENIDAQTSENVVEAEIVAEPAISIGANDKYNDETVASQDYYKADEEAKKPYYLRVKDSLDELLRNSEKLDALCKAIPDSDWVKVDYGSGYYIVGIIYSSGKVKYICYGASGKYGYAPEELKGYCAFLPLSGENLSDGYYVVYQDAESGELKKTEEIF